MIAGLVAGASLVADWRGDAELRRDRQASRDPFAERAPPPAAIVETLANAEHAFSSWPRRDVPGPPEGALKLKETCGLTPKRFLAEVLHGPAELAGPAFSSSPSCRPTPGARAWRRRWRSFIDAGAA